MDITNKISLVFGKFANKEFNPVLQTFINNSYVKILDLDMSDFAEPSKYKTLNHLFTRELLKNRDIDMSLNSFISPADSKIVQQGSIEDGISFQIKGMEYSVDELLTDHISKENRQKIQNGDYMNFYLSPKDYHRYHNSYDCTVTKLIHIPGKLYPVNLTYLNKEKDLYIKNERVVLECLADNGKLFYMVFVGALNVGQMVFHFEPKVETNTNMRDITVYEYEDLRLSKAQEIGYFKMGSTVVILWEEDFVMLDDLLDTKILFGNKIAKIKGD